MMEAVLDIDIARSAALFAEKRYEQARRIMEKALSFAEAEGYVRPFFNHVAVVLPLLNDMKRAKLDLRQSSHLKVIMAASAAGDKAPAGMKQPEGHKNSGLTERETEILKLMAAGCRYKEIAQRTFVSFETVKTHVKHVFEKLDVDSRAKAVNRARDLRLLWQTDRDSFFRDVRSIIRDARSQPATLILNSQHLERSAKFIPL